MDVHFTPELEKKLNDLAAQTGRGTDELVQDAVAGFVVLGINGTKNRVNATRDMQSAGLPTPSLGQKVL